MSEKTNPRRLQPESLYQARRFDHNYRLYRDAGFCGLDAAHAADGHSIGFTHVAPIRGCCKGKTVPESHAGEKDIERWVAGGDLLD